jgi:tape measure domain-containing protein
MSSYDDWVVNFKVNTKPIEDAIKKVNKLRQEVSGLYGGGSSRRGAGTSSSSARGRMTRTAEERAELNAYKEDAKRTRDLSKAELQAYDEQAKRLTKSAQAERKLAQLEATAYKEEAKRSRELGRLAEKARLEKARAYGSAGNNSASWSRRRGAAVGSLTAENPQARSMRSYYASLERKDSARRSSIEQMREVQMASQRAAEERRIAAIQQRRDMELYNQRGYAANRARVSGDRSTRLENARANRNYDLDRLDTRARMAGANIDRDQLSALRQRVAGASSFTSLGGLSAEMKAFRDATNAAISRQNALTKQMNQSNFATNAFSNSIKNMAASFVGIYGVLGAVKSLYDNSKELQNNQNKLLMGTGGKIEAAKAFGKIKGVAQETGLGINQVTDLYGKLAINAKDSGMSEQSVDSIFRAVTTMMVGYGLNDEQQKLVTKAFSQMLSKQRVGAEEFANQLGDQAPGVMSGLAQAVGLTGKDAQQVLRKKMEKGEIGIDSLLKFTDIMKKRAIDTGAYGAQVSSAQAYETRLANSYKLFALSLGTQMDESIKSGFSGLTGMLESMTKWFDEQNKLQKETGEVGAFKTIMDWIILGLKDFGSMLVLAGQGIIELISKIPGLDGVQSYYKRYMANRQIEDAYFEKQGAKTPQAQAQLRMAGMPGLEQVKRDQFFSVDPKATEAAYQNFSQSLSGAQSFTGNTFIDSKVNMQRAVVDAISGLSDSITKSLTEVMSKAVSSINDPVFNIHGADDPVATGKEVVNQLNQWLIYPR